MIRDVRNMTILLLIPLLLAACAGGAGGEGETKQEPALIMFFTEN